MGRVTRHSLERSQLSLLTGLPLSWRDPPRLQVWRRGPGSTPATWPAFHTAIGAPLHCPPGRQSSACTEQAQVRHDRSPTLASTRQVFLVQMETAWGSASPRGGDAGTGARAALSRDAPLLTHLYPGSRHSGWPVMALSKYLANDYYFPRREEGAAQVPTAEEQLTAPFQGRCHLPLPPPASQRHRD